jgi:hypothetical protein
MICLPDARFVAARASVRQPSCARGRRVWRRSQRQKEKLDLPLMAAAVACAPEGYSRQGTKRGPRARAAPLAGHSAMLTLITCTGVRGRSEASVGVVSIFFTTSCPDVTLPNTGCRDSPGENQSRKLLCTVLMKN